MKDFMHHFRDKLCFFTLLLYKPGPFECAFPESMQMRPLNSFQYGRNCMLFTRVLPFRLGFLSGKQFAQSICSSLVVKKKLCVAGKRAHHTHRPPVPSLFPYVRIIAPPLS
jgi:hypothetical protein